MVGNEFRIPMKVQRNQSVGFRSENEWLPAPGASKYSYLTEPLRYAYSLFNITGQLFRAAETNQGAFVTAFKQEMDDTTLASKLDFNRAAYGDGSGKMCSLTATGAGGGSLALNSTVLNVDSTINFRGLGEVVDFVNAAGAVLDAAQTVTAVDRVNLTITITPGLTANALTAGTHYPVRASSDSSVAVPNNSQNREINGLANIVDNTGVLHGFNPATYSFWASYVNAVNGSISDSVMRLAKDTVGFNAGLDLENGLDFALITTRGIRRRYADTLTGLKRFNNADAVKLHGGFRH